jgi:hypothetical protein
VSVDSSGLINVWPYEPFAYNGFGWYEPAKSTRIELAMPTLTSPNLIAAKKAGGLQAVAALESDVFPVPPLKKLRDGAVAASNPSFLIASKSAKARFDSLVASGQIMAEPWYSIPPSTKGWKQYHLEAEKQQQQQQQQQQDTSKVHVLSMDENGDLLSHQVQKFSSCVNQGTILSVCSNSNDTQLIVLIQFEAVPPKPAFLEIVKVDIYSLQIVGPRIQVPPPPSFPISLSVTSFFCSFPQIFACCTGASASPNSPRGYLSCECLCYTSTSPVHCLAVPTVAHSLPGSAADRLCVSLPHG